jgi:hypothetical protein
MYQAKKNGKARYEIAPRIGTLPDAARDTATARPRAPDFAAEVRDGQPPQ